MVVLFNKTEKEFGYSFETATVWNDFYCICDYCRCEFLRSKRNLLVGWNVIKKESCGNSECVKQKREESSLVKHGVKNAGGTKESIEKGKKTFQETYGLEVTNAMCIPGVPEKIENTCRERFGYKSFLATPQCREMTKQKCLKETGYEFYSQAPECKQKARNTCMENYGKEYYSQTKEWLESVQNTSLKKWGETNYSKTKECQNKMEYTCLKEYGVKHYSQTEEYKIKFKDTSEKRYNVPHPSQTEWFQNKCKETCKERYFSEHPMQNKDVLNKALGTRIKNYGTLRPVNLGKTQKSIMDWLNGYGFSFKTIVMNGQEIDLYDENVRLGIEYNGLRWHSEQFGRGKEYHYNKYKLCKESGIKLISIFEDEWMHKKDICKSLILSYLNKNKNNIDVKECIVCPLEQYIVNNFLMKYSLFGLVDSFEMSFGITHDDILIGVAVLKKEDQNIVLERMCFSNFINIINGGNELLSKCIEWAKNNNYIEIVARADNRWTDSFVYTNLGFNVDGEEAPEYKYVKNKKRIDDELTAKQNNLFKIWDCGKEKLSYKL